MNYAKNISDFIVVCENVLTHEICDQIINEYSDDHEYQKAQINEGIVDESFRKLKSVNLSHDVSISKNQQIRSFLDNAIFEGVGAAIKSYGSKFPLVTAKIDTGYDLLRYEEGDFYGEHTDHYFEHPRTVSCSISLNDDFAGGEFGFFGKELIVKAPKGAAVMFPSNFLYPHEILPITQGTRYSIITWFI